MTEVQRRPVPRTGGPELETALAFLTFARESVLIKTEGLDERDLRREMVPTGTNLLGLVAHLAASEQWWFHHHLAGEPLPAGHHFEMAVPLEVPAAEVFDAYDAAIAHSDALIRAAADPDAPLAEHVDGEVLTLRWVLAHMTTETTRHAGHADILRELIDGTTGR